MPEDSGPSLEIVLTAVNLSNRQVDSTFWVERQLAHHVRRLLVQAQDFRDEIDGLQEQIAVFEADADKTAVPDVD